MTHCPDIEEDDDGGVTHLIPVDEFREHLPSDECWCCPEIDEEADELTFIHNSECSGTIH